MIDSLTTLPDGRTLAYAGYGVTDGPLVMYFHGTPSSRLDLVALDDAFVGLGVRVVAPDRPGMGGSTACASRSLSGWADDVASLADHLGAYQFAVMGLSGGGPYAVACAACLPGRVLSAGAVAGVTDMGWPTALQGFPEEESTIMALGNEEAAVLWCEERFGADGSKFFEVEMDLAPADLELMADASTTGGFLNTVIEAFRQGVRGYAQDVLVNTQPWSFDLAAVTATVRVLHGEADTIVPIAHGRHTAELIPGATLVVYPSHGHLSIMTELPQLAADLASAIG